MRGDLFGPLERSVASTGPTRVKVIVSVLAAEVVDAFQLIINCISKPIEDDHFVERTRKTTFSTTAVISPNVQEQCVVDGCSPWYIE